MIFTIHVKCSSYNVKEKHRNQTVHSVNFNYLKIRTVCNTEALTLGANVSSRGVLSRRSTQKLKAKAEDSIKVPPRNLSNILLRWGCGGRVVWTPREGSMHSALPLI